MIGRKGVMSKTPETEQIPPTILPPEKQQLANHKKVEMTGSDKAIRKSYIAC